MAASNPRRVTLARHGQTELNRLGVVQGSGIDPGLNALGRAQAEALYAVHAGSVDLVASSGMLRARETAADFVTAGVPYVEDRRLREICWGEYEGKVPDERMRAEYTELMRRWESGDYSAAHPGGESATELAERLWAAWRDFVERDFRHALIVTHGRALRCLTCLLAGRPLSDMNAFAHANAGYYTVTLEGGRWTLGSEHSVDHLAALDESKPEPS